MNYYLTYYEKHETHPNLTLLDVLAGVSNETKIITKTTPITNISEPLAISKLNINCIITTWPLEKDKIKYNTFYIPKKKGGYRTINAPDAYLMQVLENYKYQIESLNVLPHDAAHAYVKNRSTVTALQVHQKNQSKWFLKLDFTDFFGSFTKERVLEQLKQVYPFAVMLLIPQNKQNIETMIEHCLKDGVLPQGAPTSPILTNICMVPIDFAISAYCKKAGLIYTRYADDIIISSKEPFDFKAIERAIKTKLTPEWLQINPNKTRYGSNGGRNWNLGLMLNKDNNITIGHKKKEILKATIYRALTSELTAQEKMEIQGYISYTRQIEPGYVNQIIRRLEQKTGQNLKSKLK